MRPSHDRDLLIEIRLRQGGLNHQVKFYLFLQNRLVMQRESGLSDLNILKYEFAVSRIGRANTCNPPRTSFGSEAEVDVSFRTSI